MADHEPVKPPQGDVPEDSHAYMQRMMREYQAWVQTPEGQAAHEEYLRRVKQSMDEIGERYERKRREANRGFVLSMSWIGAWTFASVVNKWVDGPAWVEDLCLFMTLIALARAMVGAVQAIREIIILKRGGRVE